MAEKYYIVSDSHRIICVEFYGIENEWDDEVQIKDELGNIFWIDKSELFICYEDAELELEKYYHVDTFNFEDLAVVK